MNNILIKLSIIIFLTSHGCENINEAEIDLKFVEKIVVSAELESGTEFPGIIITKTLPIGVEYSIQKAEIKNALVYIKINGIKSVPLHYLRDGLYKPKDSLIVNSGETYELFGSIDGKTFYSKTRIPLRPSISNALRETDFLQAAVNPKEGEVYAAIWFISSSVPGENLAEASAFSSVTDASESSSAEIFTVRTASIPEFYLSPGYSGRLFIEVYSFDTAYLKYYNSRVNQQVITNTFIQAGESVVWNVYGENTIGLFIGKAKSRLSAN